MLRKSFAGGIILIFVLSSLIPMASSDTSTFNKIIYVDDGSSDDSLALVESFQSQSSLVRSVSLSRNFGKESAMSAGLEHCNGLAVILIDADLQDPPELIPDMLAKWREGYDVVNMTC